MEIPLSGNPLKKHHLTALATQKICEQALADFGQAPEGLIQTLIGEREIGEALTSSSDVAIISATGSTRMGRAVGQQVASRFGRSILELGGNNAMIVTPSADLEMALRAIVFSAVGTAGQRCTSLRRLIAHESVYNELLLRLKRIYETLPIGNPFDEKTLVGPLIDQQALEAMQLALNEAAQNGGAVFGGEEVRMEHFAEAAYVAPAIVEMPAQTELMKRETFAPILYALKYSDLNEAIALHNDVPQGLSSCIFQRMSVKPNVFSAQQDRIAVSPMSTSAPQAQKLAGHLAVRRKPVADGNPALMPGKATCDARPIRSIILRSSPWLRVSSSKSESITRSVSRAL